MEEAVEGGRAERKRAAVATEVVPAGVVNMVEVEPSEITVLSVPYLVGSRMALTGCLLEEDLVTASPVQ